MGRLIRILSVIAIVVVIIQIIEVAKEYNNIRMLPKKARSLQRGVTEMKKRHIVINCLFVFMLTAGFTGCGSTSRQSSVGEYVDDSVITTKVKSLLAADDFLKSFNIGVETYKGSVQLSGFVATQKAVDKAEEIAQGVKGVESVKNDLIVK